MFRAAILGLLSLCFTASAEAATLHVSTTGSDGAQCTQSAPCLSLGKAYGAAATGDTIQVAPGTYPRQDVPSGTKAVTFKGGTGVKLRQLWSKASGLTYDGINIDANFVRKSTGFQVGGDNVTFKNATVGNIADEKNVISGSGHTIDNVTFHDTIMTPTGESEGVHMECLYAIGVPNFTVRNSTFRDCSVMDLFLTYGDWWSPLPPAYGNITIENNVFAHSERSSNAGWHYFGLYVANNGPNGRRVLDSWTVRNNTFETPAVVPPSGTNTRWVGNVGSWDCASGVTYRYNVGTKCGATDKQVSPASSSASVTAPFGWSNPAASDFRLKAGSPAIGAGDPNDAPRTDRDGNLRDSAPDAGAYEFGGVTAPAPEQPAPAPEPSPTPTPEPGPSPTPDTQAPATPQGMAWGTIGQTSIGVKWNATTDNVGVAGYRIYRDGVQVGTTTGTSYTVSGLTCGKSYSIGLTAVDAAGNQSSRAEATGTTSTAACTTAPAPTPTPTTGLVGAWGFNEASGATAGDASGAGNLATLSGATRTASGKFGGAVSFDGIDDFVTVPDAAKLDLSTGMTLEAWVYPTQVTGYHSVLFKENMAARRPSYALYASNGNSRPTTEVSSGSSLATLPGSQLIPANTWSHIAATFDGANLRVYRNGVLIGTRALAGALVTSGDPLKLGGNRVWSEWFKGRIDEVRVWNAARSAAQIQADMNAPV